MHIEHGCHVNCQDGDDDADQDQNQLKASGVILHVNLHLDGDLFSIS